MRCSYSLVVFYVFIIKQVSSQEDGIHGLDLRSDSATYIELQPEMSEHHQEHWSPWSRWSLCRMGSRTRRRNCLQPSVCGEGLRVEIRRCGGQHLNSENRKQRVVTVARPAPEQTSGTAKRTAEQTTALMAEQTAAPTAERTAVTTERAAALITAERTRVAERRAGRHRQKAPRGFTPWSPWSKCSRKCITVRKRWCRQKNLCGRTVMRESAYCYIEGSFCQNWIRSRVFKRNSTQSYTLELTPRQAPPHSPHSLITDSDKQTTRVTCGRLNPQHIVSPGGSMNDTRSANKAYKWPELRIIGGRTAPKGKWPWQVAVLNKFKEAFCGGTLVSLRWTVTAAHCVRRRLYVRVGEHDLRARGRHALETRVAHALVHPAYNPNTVDSDVAMLRLHVPARPDLGHGVACLPSAQEQLPPHTSCVILGWGKRNQRDEYGTNLLQEAQVWTVAQSMCRRVYWEYAITDNMVCAGRGRRDSCAGDSGGPLLCRRTDGRYVIHGITSFGDGCGRRGKYGIYTRVANYVPWILQVINHQTP